MSFPRHSFRSRGGHRGRAGFLPVEMFLGLAVLLLAAVLFFMVLGRIRHERNLERLVADLQAMAPAFQAYHRQNHRWPASTGGETELPADLAATLAETNWRNGSPFGGSYGWDARGAIMLTAFAPAFPLKLTRADLLALDRQMDDGDLATGRLRAGFNGWPVYLVGETP